MSNQEILALVAADLRALIRPDGAGQAPIEQAIEELGQTPLQSDLAQAVAMRTEYTELLVQIRERRT